MANSIYQTMQQSQNPMNSFMAEFNRFKQSFNGDPQQEIQRLVQSGQITQDQLNQAQATANQIMQAMGEK